MVLSFHSISDHPHGWHSIASSCIRFHLSLLRCYHSMVSFHSRIIAIAIRYGILPSMLTCLDAIIPSLHARACKMPSFHLLPLPLAMTFYLCVPPGIRCASCYCFISIPHLSIAIAISHGIPSDIPLNTSAHSISRPFPI